MTMFENLKADLERYCKADKSKKFQAMISCYGFWATAVYRFGRWIDLTLVNPVFLPVNSLLSAVYLGLRWMLAKAFGIQIDKKASIGKGLYIGHFAGIVVEKCRLGKNCSIHQHVHIEEALVGGRTSGPWLGDNVWIGPHARIKGSVRVGNNASIAAGAVVTSDVPGGCLVGGDPARVISLKYDNAALM